MNQVGIHLINYSEKTMKYFFPTLTLLFLSVTASAHNGEDPAAEVAKKRSYILQYQKDYKIAESKEEKISNIRKQVSALLSTVLLLNNSLVKENSSIRANMSKYDINYLAAMKNSLKDTQNLLKQVEAIIDE